MYDTIWSMFFIESTLFMLIKTLSEKFDELRKFLVPSAKQYGFNVVSSREYTQSNHSNTFSVPKQENDNIIEYPTYLSTLWSKSLFREVKLMDERYNTHNVYAAVDFEGYFCRKFKGVRWKPDLETLR